MQERNLGANNRFVYFENDCQVRPLAGVEKAILKINFSQSDRK